MYMENVFNKIRNHERVILYNGELFIRLRINPSEKRLYWIKEISFDKKSWTIQNTLLCLKDVLFIVNQVKRDRNERYS